MTPANGCLSDVNLGDGDAPGLMVHDFGPARPGPARLTLTRRRRSAAVQMIRTNARRSSHGPR